MQELGLHEGLNSGHGLKFTSLTFGLKKESVGIFFFLNRKVEKMQYKLHDAIKQNESELANIYLKI